MDDRAMTEALAAVFQGQPFSHQLMTLPVPPVKAGEVLVRVLGATICGSDRHTYEGRRQVATPTILGHEIVGEIIELGDSSIQRDLAEQSLAAGDRVTWSIVANCGHCFFCDHHLPQKCEHGIKYGHEAMRPDYQLNGGFAQYCILAPGSAIMRLPADMPLEVACPANCATATTAAAIDAAGQLTGQSIAILGAGLIGLTAAAMASQQNANNVIVVDPDAHRLQLAKRFGATQAVKPDQLASLIADVTRHGLDVVIEASGANAAFLAAFPLLRIGGTAVLVGAVAPTADVPIGLEKIVRRNLRLVGIHNYAPPHLRSAVDFLARCHQKYPFAELVSEWFSIEQIEQAFQSARDPRNVRVGVRDNNGQNDS
jgi:putative phosphonate catabolism associated alcohol dehydrogenase